MCEKGKEGGGGTVSQIISAVGEGAQRTTLSMQPLHSFTR